MASLDLHPRTDGDRYTIRGIFHEKGEAEEKAEALAGAGRHVVVMPERSPDGTELYHVGLHQSVERAERAGIPHQHTTEWDAVRVAVDRFRRVERATVRRGLAFKWYKPLEVDRLKACIESWHWQGSVLEVSEDILTKTLQAHPFPNANHRTSLFLARDYLQATGIRWPHYSLRGRGINRFHRDVEGFIHQSKYLLHTMRHQRMLEVACEAGYTHIQLSDGAEIPIRDADLAADAGELDGKHRRAAGRLLTRLAGDEGAPKLDQENGIGLGDWVKENLP